MQPSTLARLKQGGHRYGKKVEAIITSAGTPFNATGKSWMKATFDQDCRPGLRKLSSVKVCTLIWRTSMDELAGFTEEARKLALDRFRLLQPHLEQNQSLQAVARAAGIPYRTAHRWVAQYRLFGSPARGG